MAAFVVVLGIQFVLPLPKADASVIVGVTPSFPDQVNANARNVAASVTAVNSSTAPHASAMTVSSLMLVPSCGNQNLNCEGGRDPGVFELSSTGQGAAGTGCAGRTFTILLVDQGSGRVRFLPTDEGPLVLGAPDPATDLDTCRINFTFSVRKAPTVDSAPGTTGAQTNQVAWMVVVHSGGTIGFDSGVDVTTVGSNPLCFLGFC